MKSGTNKMSNITKQRATPCRGPNRRDLLRIGGLTGLGLSLPQLLRAEATQPAAARKDVKEVLKSKVKRENERKRRSCVQ